MHMLVDNARKNHLPLAIHHIVILRRYLRDIGIPYIDPRYKVILNDHTPFKAKAIAKNKSVC